MYKLVIVFLLLFNTGKLSAESLRIPKHKALEIRKDSVEIDLRAFDKNAIKAYKEEPAFNYHIQTEDRNLSWWDRFWDWFWRLIKNFFEQKNQKEINPASPVLKYLLLIVAIGGVVYLVIRLLGDDLANIFSKKSKELHIPFSETSENIHEISFEEEIEKALHNNNFRLAVRLLFLNTLKNLNDAELINWQIEKTNTAYLNELKNQDQRAYFSVLTRQFEYVWYGDFHVNRQSFENIKTLFTDFKVTSHERL